MAKVSVIGAGLVGATTAQHTAALSVADVVLLDVAGGTSLEQRPIKSRQARVATTADAGDTAGSDVVVIAVGGPYRAGVTAEEAIAANASIVQLVAEEASTRSPHATYVVLTSPVEAMTALVRRTAGVSGRRVLGMSTTLAAARLGTLVSAELGVAADDTRAVVLGGHGAQMVPLLRYTTVGGVPITELLAAEKIATLCQRVARASAEAASLLECTTASYAPGAVAAHVVRAVVADRRRLVSCAVHADGRYGLDDIPIGLPAIVGRGGAVELLEPPLFSSEIEALHRAAAAIRKRLGVLDSWRRQSPRAAEVAPAFS